MNAPVTPKRGGTPRGGAKPRPRVRFSLRWKITLPFMFLALILGLGAIYLINRLLVEDEQVRFQRQLADSGRQAADAVVRLETDLLSAERLVANTEGVVGGVAQADAEGLRALVLPLVINSGVDMVSILDSQGTSLLTVRAQPGSQAREYDTLRGEAFYPEWPFVRDVLQGTADATIGDKFAGLHPLRLGEQEIYIFMVAGPLREPEGSILGAVVVGKYLADVVALLSQDAGANISIYESASGRLLGTSLEPEDPVALTLSLELIEYARSPGEGRSSTRSFVNAGAPYGEVFTPLLARRGTQELAIMGVSLLETSLFTTSPQRVAAVIRYAAAMLALVVVVGLVISNSITRPLVEIAEASAQVARGDLSRRVPERGSDEIGVLARTFNRMVAGLKEGSIYRDLLGRTVTPEVRDELRKSMSEGAMVTRAEAAPGTILFADLRGFTTMAEEAPPDEVLSTLNDCFSGLVPVISQHGGVVSKFDGDAIMAFFGILPRALPPPVSALQACHAAMEMADFIRELNRSRKTKGKEPLALGIGIATGPVIAGGLGSQDRLHYTVIGDTVNTAQRIQQLTADMGETGVLIGDETYRALGSAQGQFVFGRSGAAQLRGKSRQVSIYELKGRKTRLVKAGQRAPG